MSLVIDLSDYGKQSFSDILDDKYIETVCFIDKLFKHYIKKPNWKNNIDVKNQIEQELDDYLFDKKINVLELDKFLQKAYELGINNYI